MSVITISRGSFSGGKEFAEHLARDLGYQVISREDLAEEAIKKKVPVGKLQTAMIKPPRYYQRMGKERDLYIACITSLLCERILQEDVVYHGHTGHLLLSEIPHILRIRVVANMENRIKWVENNLSLTREKAKEYIEQVDGDRDKWIRFLYNIDWHDPSHYDLILHLDQLGVSNATSALCSMAQLPDFKLSPASVKAIQNLQLKSKAIFTLGLDPRTRDAEVKVTADEGTVSITYMPYETDMVQYVPEVLEKIPECKAVRCGIARTNILWLQDEFEPESAEFTHILKLAKKSDAAVELIRLMSSEQSQVPQQKTMQKQAMMQQITAHSNGGILDDVQDEPIIDENLNKTLDELQKAGCSGGSSTIYGDAESLLSTLRRKTDYSMMIIGKIFTDKSSAARTRKTNELRSLLTDNVGVPVLGLEDLEKQFQFGIKGFVQLLGYLAITLILFLIVFVNQESIVQIFAGDAYKAYRIITILALLVFIPVFAFSYGNFIHKILKFFGLD